ncbi:MAG: DUF5808 domain-containing protein [Saccharofermentans sp.]|nr:DUF5808 domain-containing protein [Saccharofermentans sp.]
MPWIISLVMFVCVVPTAVLLFAMGFPKEPGKKKLIFGVRDNPKFHEGDAAKKVKDIVSSCRKSALIITIIVCLISVILLILPVSGGTMLAWMLLVFVMFVIAVPFGKGNTELKNLKKELGITKSGVVYTDLTNTNTVHALKLPWIILPNAIALAGTVFAILADLGMIRIVDNIAIGKNGLTALSLSFCSLAVMFVPLAMMMDNTRNMVISRDSSINANYNRAKKKTWADLMIAMSWVNALFLISYSILCMFVNNEAVIVGGILVYTVLLMLIAVIGFVNQKSIEKRYERDTELELQDDDDNWILGMFYYNPNDTRLNVEKRFGFGSTINIAHPAGKVIMALTVLLLIGTIGYLVYLVATGQLDKVQMNALN